MSMSDPVADLLTRIRNAHLARKYDVKIPSSKLKLAILKVLLDEGYIVSYTEILVNNKPTIEVLLKYYAGSSVIETIKRVSKPGLRIYKSCATLPTIMNGMGIAILSTSKGVMTERSARTAGIGGEILCYVT